ncbi:hypothetical protein CEQ90_12355 [Lewinellaceae bacterium SD302]|nr:hypothetical protein CEQ90_12355 [Lewinellaceae bacterium SD302]
MPSRLIGILLCLVLANVVNYAVGEWLDSRIPGWLPPEASLDGSSLSSSLAYQKLLDGELPATETNASPLTKVIIPYYGYLAEGGGENWLAWRAAYDAHYGEIVGQSGSQEANTWRSNFLTMVDRTALCKYGSLLLLIVLALLLRGNLLKEQHWWTPLIYALGVGLTAGLYTCFAAPLWLIIVVVSFLIYAVALRLMLPIYNYEWSKSLRPFLTLVFFLLAMMSWRGPEWIDYLFWTSQLYRLGLTLVVLLTLFFHWSILDKTLRNAELDLTSRITGYAMPLGTLAIYLGLILTFYNASRGGAMAALNREILFLSPSVVSSFNPESPFVLFFVGVGMLILGGIGYFIQRIAK